jgi:hypothetical protein
VHYTKVLISFHFLTNAEKKDEDDEENEDEDKKTQYLKSVVCIVARALCFTHVTNASRRQFQSNKS